MLLKEFLEPLGVSQVEAATRMSIPFQRLHGIGVDRRVMTIASLDSLDERIRRAIAEKRLLEIRYKRAVRLAEPHDYGVIDGTERLLIFQLHGPDSGKGAVGWRLLDVVKIESGVVTDQTFAGSRGQSHQQHYQWERLYARVT